MRRPMPWSDWSEPEIRERPVGLLLIAATSALAGAAILASSVELVAGATRYADWTTPRMVGNDLVGMVQVYPEHYVLMGAILLIPSLFLIALAIGIARQRPWAWVLGFVAGGLITLYGVLALVIPGDLASNNERWHLTGVPWIILGVFLLRYFDRRPVKNDLGWGDPAIG